MYQMFGGPRDREAVLTFDAGRTRPFSGVVLDGGWDGARGAGEWIVERSSNGSTWTEVAVGQPEVGGVQRVVFDTTWSQMLRIRMVVPAGGVLSLAEVRLLR